MQINVRKHHNVGFGFPLNHYIRHTKNSRGMEYLKIFVLLFYPYKL